MNNYPVNIRRYWVGSLSCALVMAIAPIRLMAQEHATKSKVQRPPVELKLDPFYEKHVDAGGLPIIGSKKVPDDALIMATELVNHMLAKRADIRRALIAGRVRVAVMSKVELTTDIPEHSQLKPKDHWDRRARGLGGTPHIPTTSCAEENLLGYADDRYNGESILIHEFAHTIHEVGMKAVDPTFDDRLQQLHLRAKEKGLWKDTYAFTNHREYWAEGVQSYFDCNTQADPANGVHNHVRTREQLQKYDPDLAALIAEIFANSNWRWTPNGAHQLKWKK